MQPVLSEPVSRADLIARERSRILAALTDQVELLADRGAAAIREEIPYYRAAAESLASDMRRQVLLNYATKLRLLREQREPKLEDLSFIRQAAIRRARAGCGLEDYVNAWRVGQQLFWDALIELAGDSPCGREAALSLVRPVMRYVDFASAHAAHVYAEFQRYAVIDAHHEREGLLERLLAGELPTAGPLLAAAHAYGFARDASLLVVSAIPVDATASPDRLHAGGASIARLGVAEAKTLVVVRHTEVVAIPLVDRRMSADEICARLDAVQRTLAAADLPLAIGVSTIAHGVSELPRALIEARTAAQHLEGRAGLVALPRLTAFEYLVLHADRTAGRLVDPRISAFLEEDRMRGDVLRTTLQAFIAADLNVRAVAEGLHVHPNTAHYRLARVKKLTGRNPRTVTDLLELHVAMLLDERSGAPSSVATRVA